MASNLSDEQIITLLEYLFTNMNNLDRLYYDMFINTTPLMLTLERYNEDGVLEKYQIPNRAMDRQETLQGRGTPEGAVEASIGVMYFDVMSNDIYIKTVDGGAYGWVLFRTSGNFIQGEDYLTPTGSGAKLTDISVSSLIEGAGVLKVGVGGTGTTGLTGIIKGMGDTQPYTAALAGVDYVLPDQFIGCIGMFPYDAELLPEGWLPADGSSVSQIDYPKLYAKFGDKYNTESTIVGKFGLPDYRGFYLRGHSVRNSENQVISVGDEEYPAIPNITGLIPGTEEGQMYGVDYSAPSGAFYTKGTNVTNGESVNNKYDNDVFGFDASRCSNVYNNNVSEVRVKGKYVLVCVYAGLPEIVEDSEE